MTASHFFTDPASISGDNVTLTGDEAHHASRVLRVRVGEEITVADGSGRVVTATVTSTTGDVVATITDVEMHASPVPAITLCQALVKGDKFDDVVEKSAEIGVRRLIPFTAERSIVRWDSAKERKAAERWRSISRAAAKQSRSSWIMCVDDVAADVLSAISGAGAVLVLHEGSNVPMRTALPSVPVSAVALVVGPEGGLSDDEVEAFSRAGAMVVSLGTHVLRSETAGIVAATIVGYVYGDIG